jgi:hypothetical protein
LPRLIVLASLFPLVLGLAVPASASHDLSDLPEFDPAAMVFPVGGSDYRIADNFGVCRDGCTRSHEGVDIMAPKGAPVYAVAAGVVTWVSDSHSNCCRLAIDHGDGWFTRYIHLNNDTQNEDGSYSDDGQGWGIVDGIINGTFVTAGQMIGWVGDSGNAENTAPHLHFELRKSDSGSHWQSVAIDAYTYLVNAQGNWVGQFWDDDSSVHQANIDRIYQAGITEGCNPPLNNQFCPSKSITRGQMAAFIARALGLSATTGTTPFDDLNGHQFQNAVDKLMTAGIGFGCDSDSFCPDQPLLRDEMAEMLVRAFGFDNPDGTDFFTDDNGNRFEASINKLAAHGITVGCNPPDYDRYCPGDDITRGQMATFFVRVGAA